MSDVWDGPLVNCQHLISDVLTSDITIIASWKHLSSPLCRLYCSKDSLLEFSITDRWSSLIITSFPSFVAFCGCWYWNVPPNLRGNLASQFQSQGQRSYKLTSYWHCCSKPWSCSHPTVPRSSHAQTTALGTKAAQKAAEKVGSWQFPGPEHFSWPKNRVTL